MPPLKQTPEIEGIPAAEVVTDDDTVTLNDGRQQHVVLHREGELQRAGHAVPQPAAADEPRVVEPDAVGDPQRGSQAAGALRPVHLFQRVAGDTHSQGTNHFVV